MRKPVNITVLMPVYNAAGYIRTAMDSILEQSYRAFEFLIIDDGSTDGTGDLIRAYADSRIRLIRHEQNQGLRHSLNEGIALASGRLIARMDADDQSHPWRLDKQMAYMEAHPDCAMVDSWVNLMDKEGRFLKKDGGYGRYVYYNLHFECCIYHSAIMFRKEMVQRIGGYQLPFAEDYDLFLRLSRVYKIHTLEEPLLWYRVHDTNLNTVGKKKEYDTFTAAVLKQNVQALLGPAAAVPAAYWACYRYDMAPILALNSLAACKQCITLLDAFSRQILLTENPNRNTRDIRYMWAFKKKLIVQELASRLPLMKRMSLLWFCKWPGLTFSIFFNRIKRPHAVTRSYTR